ncbi:unnamed protein product [Ophioblennius macclurei]
MTGEAEGRCTEQTKGWTMW